MLDLDQVERPAGQLAQSGGARAEVVDRQAHARGPDSAQRPGLCATDEIRKLGKCEGQ